MKKFLQRVVLVAVAMATAQVAVAESWRINNDTSKGAHFVDINAAMASEDVKDGDVLYLDPGCVLTTEQIITKAVTIIGAGWEHSDKPFVPPVITAQLTIKSAASIIGVYVNNNINLYQNNILLERCKLNRLSASNSKLTDVKVIGSIVNNGIMGNSGERWTICNSYIQNVYRTNMSCVSSLSQSSITNCFVQHLDSWSDATYALSVDNSTVKNNVIVCTGNVPLSNIIKGNDNVIYNNCLSADVEHSLASSNVCTGNKSLEHYIVNNGAAGGAWMQLCEGSPAIGAGEGGIDCGPYSKGSLYPFVTHGMPKHIPYFTEAVVPAQPTDGKVKVSLKIVNQND